MGKLPPSFKTRFDDIWTNTVDYANVANVSEPLTRNDDTYPIDPGLNVPSDDSYQDRLVPLIDAEPVTLDKAVWYVGGGEGNWVIIVTAPDAACTFTAVCDSPWLIVKATIPATPAGSGSVEVRAVTNSGPKRTGHVTIGGAVYTVTQGGGS